MTSLEKNILIFKVAKPFKMSLTHSMTVFQSIFLMILFIRSVL